MFSNKLLSQLPLILCLLGLAVSSNINAAPFTLDDWIFNIDGTLSEGYYGDPFPTTGTLTDGLGTLSLDVADAGTHNIITFFDYEIDQDLNTFFNESGQTVGSVFSDAHATQSWEIDEPKYFFGDIIDNVLAGSLDNYNNVPAGMEDDVGLALGWNFFLSPDDTATISYVLTDVLPTVDFYLKQYDPDSNRSLYFYSAIDIQSTGTAARPNITVDEPATGFLMLIGLAGITLRNKSLTTK